MSRRLLIPSEGREAGHSFLVSQSSDIIGTYSNRYRNDFLCRAQMFFGPRRCQPYNGFFTNPNIIKTFIFPWFQASIIPSISGMRGSVFDIWGSVESVFISSDRSSYSDLGLPYIYISIQTTFSDFHSVHWGNWCYKCRSNLLIECPIFQCFNVPMFQSVFPFIGLQEFLVHVHWSIGPLVPWSIGPLHYALSNEN